MYITKPKHKRIVLTICLGWLCALAVAQGDMSTIKGQIALGVNHPFKSGFVDGFEAKPANFPTVNLGVQYMFKPNLGAKLDYGFHRISSSNSSQTTFKLNYARVNLQLVYDASGLFYVSPRTGVFLHAGPGLSFVKPLGDFTANDLSFLNTMGGIELHYGILDTISLYADVSYIASFASDFDPTSTGLGAFNGNLLTVTFGVSLSLSGCYYCNR